MATELSRVELDITQEIINIGIAKAADSLSFFIKGKVWIQLLDIKMNSASYSPLSRKYPTAKNYLLTTVIKGEAKGIAYLLFNELEAEKIGDTNLPDSIKNNSVEKAKMMEAFLLEIDNIITGSVITQFSNILQCKIYGDVPSLKILAGHEINQYLSEKHSDDLNSIYFNVRFITENMDLTPEFIWLLDDKIFNSFKHLVSDEKKKELFQKLNINN